MSICYLKNTEEYSNKTRNKHLRLFLHFHLLFSSSSFIYSFALPVFSCFFLFVLFFFSLVYFFLLFFSFFYFFFFFFILFSFIFFFAVFCCVSPLIFRFSFDFIHCTFCFI